MNDLSKSERRAYLRGLNRALALLEEEFAARSDGGQKALILELKARIEKERG